MIGREKITREHAKERSTESVKRPGRTYPSRDRSYGMGKIWTAMAEHSRGTDHLMKYVGDEQDLEEPTKEKLYKLAEELCSL
jgi:hypothetical protein